MLKEEEQRKGSRLTMIFRKNKDVFPVVKYSIDSKFIESSMYGHASADVFKDPDIIFNSWITYPAVKTCDAFRKLSTYERLENNPVEQDPNVVEIRNSTDNLARRTIELLKYYQDKITDHGSLLFETIMQAKPDGKTMRGCPNIRDLLTHSLVVTAPVDIHFSKTNLKEIYPDVKDRFDEIGWLWNCPEPWFLSRANNILGERHNKSQFCFGKDSKLHGYSNLKIDTGIQLELPDNVIAMMHSPTFHEPEQPFVTIPGMWTYPQNKYAAMIINLWIRDDQEDFVIKKGDPFFYVTFSEQVKIQKHEKGNDRLIKFKEDEPQMSFRNFSAKNKY